MTRKRGSPAASDSDEESSPPPAKQHRSSSHQDKENSENSSQSIIQSPLKSINPAGRPAEAGVIKRIYVENFMCHRKLTIDLCRNVNFIHGQNGSGKSAVLAAIQVCLGAGARRTHRARSLKDLVRKEAGEHCTGAKVRVTLLNGGQDGFQPDVYGDTITVERTISLRSGGPNGYKLLDSNGVVRSNSKKDLDAMLDQLNIQVENPVAVLDQEESKKFLTGKSTDKYNFFTKATELERIDISYRNVVDNIATLEENKAKVEQSLQSKVDVVHKLKKEWDQYQALGTLERKVLDYRVDYAWAFYHHVQEELDGQQEILDKFREKKQRREEELTQVETLTNGPDDEQQLKQERLVQLTEESQQAAHTKRTLEAELKRAQAPVRAKERDIKSIEREQQNAARNLQNAKRALQEEREKILAAAGQSDEAKRAATLKEAEAEQDALQEKIQQLKQSVTIHQRKYEEMEPSIDNAKSQTDSIMRHLNAVRNKLRQLESGGGDNLAVFGRTCSKVDRMVKQAQREGRWTGPVAGPIGAHVTIAAGKEKYSKIAERALGNNALDRFVVTNHRDRKLLQQIREQAGCQSSECGIFQVADSPRYRIPPPPSADVETCASCFTIDNDLIFNAMVDHLRIDQRAVCESKEQSEASLLVKDNHGRLSIRGGTIREVFFLPHGDRWVLTNGNLSLTSNGSKLKQTLGVDRTAAIAELNAEDEQLVAEHQECTTKQNQLERERKDAQKKWNVDRQQLRKAKARADELADTINQVRAESEESANVTIDTTELEQDVANAEQVVEALEEQLAERQRELEELKPAVEDVQNRLVEVTSRNVKVLADISAAEQDLQAYMQAMTQREEKLKKTKEKLDKMQQVLSQQEAKVAAMAKDRDDALRKAREIHYRRDVERARLEEEDENNDMSTPPATEETIAEPTEAELAAIEPVETKKEADFYKSKIARTQKKIEDEKKRRRLTESDPQVAFEKYMRAKADLDGSMKQIEAIEENVSFLMEDLKVRRKKWQQFRSHIVTMTNETFNDILNRKGSSGELNFCHNEGTLDLSVQKDSEQESTQTDDVKALSGGERSFTTLALLLALGERLETPFRVMDEFDVFLDPVARKIALDTLVEMAKHMSHRQFIFITPQDLSALKTDPLLKIHRMKPPAREGLVGGPSQRTLDFSQASDE